MAEAAKDTIYIDVEDEITTVIDKVTSSDKKLVALVLPKRAAVFQSVVNMKLLKLKSNSAGKNLVLITTESSLLPLAGSVGLYVAKTLSSKPEIPLAPIMNESIVEADELDSIPITTDDPDDVDLSALSAAPIGVLAAKKANDAIDDDGVETIDLDNETFNDKPDSAAKDDVPKPSKADTKKSKKDKSLKVPNFERFRKWLIIGLIGLVILLVLGFILLHTLPKASIYVQTDASNVNSSVNINLSTTATTLDPSTNTVPAKQVNETKTYTATTNATGQQNNGQKATGSAVMIAGACSGTIPNDIPAGTGISSGGLTFITQQSTTFVPVVHNKQCTLQGQNPSGTSSIPISAQNGGANYNLNNSNFTVPGYSQVNANGTTTGGTDQFVQVVSQTDITTAENKIVTNSPGAKQELSTQLSQNNYYPLVDTFTTANPTITPSQAAGANASSVTVTEAVNYTMYGARQSDLNTLLNSSIKQQVGANQSILNNGISTASFSSNGSPTALTMQTTAVVGPNINVATIKTQVAGKKSAEIQANVGNNPHVTSVTVKFSPFYVSTAPTNTSKISVVIAKPTNSGANASH
jgi:hypothetical protein